MIRRACVVGYLKSCLMRNRANASYNLNHEKSTQLHTDLRALTSRYYSSKNGSVDEPECKELEISIPGGKIAAKAWGSETSYPVIAFHGWLDNCGTFDKLIPLLSNQYYFVAVDAPGHGRSFHKPPGALYTEIGMVMDFKHIIDTLGWTKFHVIGHSLGAALAMLFACTFPELVEKLIMIDVLKPYSAAEDIIPAMKCHSIKAHIKYEKKLSNSPPIYNYKDAAKRLILGMHNEVDEEGIEILLKRGIKRSHCGKGFIFTRDLRCRPIEPLSVRCHETTEHIVSTLKSDLLIILANNTHPDYQTESSETITRFLSFYEKHLKNFVLTYVDGNHFVHLNNPERIAPIINDFLAQDFSIDK